MQESSDSSFFLYYFKTFFLLFLYTGIKEWSFFLAMLASSVDYNGGQSIFTVNHGGCTDIHVPQKINHIDLENHFLIPVASP